MGDAGSMGGAGSQSAVTNTGSYAYIVYKSGSTYYAKSSADSSMLSSNTNPATVIAAAFATGKDIYISSGTYTFQAGFGGISYPPSTRMKVVAAHDADFIVPNGYASSVFALGRYVTNVEWYGGEFHEAGTPARNWFAFAMWNNESGADPAAGNFNNKVGGFFCQDAFVPIRISTDGQGGWVNGNIFHDWHAWRCKYAIWHIRTAGTLADTHNFNRFENIFFQCDAITVQGIKDIQGQGNVYENVLLWDLQTGNSGAGAVSCNLLSNARDTEFRGSNAGDSLLTDPSLNAGTNTKSDRILPIPYSYVIQKLGSSYIAIDKNGKIVKNSTDPAVVLQYACNNMPDAGALGTGGTIFCKKGNYSFTTAGTNGVNIDAAVTACHGIIITGEGKNATNFNFTPSSALTNAFRFKIFDSGLSHLSINCNANVTNAIKIEGNGQYGFIDHCRIQGATAAPPTTGQIGILNDGTTAATYYWQFLHTDFNQLDTAIKCGTPYSNANFFDNLSFINCNGGIDLLTALHMCDNIFFQATSTVGDWAVRLNGSSSTYNNILNVTSDLMSKSGSATVKLTSGAVANNVAGGMNSGGTTISDSSAQKNSLKAGNFANLATQTPGASPYTYTNTTGSAQEVTVGGGTVSQILFIRAPDTSGLNTGLTSGVFSLEGNDGLKITYTVAPTMLKIGH